MWNLLCTLVLCFHYRPSDKQGKSKNWRVNDDCRKGIPKYLMSLWVKKTFGNNEYRDMIHQESASFNLNQIFLTFEWLLFSFQSDILKPHDDNIFQWYRMPFSGRINKNFRSSSETKYAKYNGIFDLVVCLVWISKNYVF